MNVLHRPTKFDLARRVCLLLIFVFAVEQSGEPLTTLGLPQTVVTNNPKAGVHTRLTDEGAPWIAEFFPWAIHEYGKSAFNWWHITSGEGSHLLGNKFRTRSRSTFPRPI